MADTTPVDAIIYTSTHCPDCRRTKMFFDSSGITYREVNVEEDSDALDLLRAMGETRVPVGVAGDLRWSGQRPDMIVRLTSQLRREREEARTTAA